MAHFPQHPWHVRIKLGLFALPFQRYYIVRIGSGSCKLPLGGSHLYINDNEAPPWRATRIAYYGDRGISDIIAPDDRMEAMAKQILEG